MTSKVQQAQKWTTALTKKGTTKHKTFYLGCNIEFGKTELANGKLLLWLIVDGELIKNHGIEWNDMITLSRIEVLEYIKTQYVKNCKDKLDTLLSKSKTIEINKFGDGYDINNF